MKKSLLLCILMLCLCFCTACSNENDTEQEEYSLKTEVDAELEAAKSGKYENLNIICDEVRLPQNNKVESMRFPLYTFTKEMTLAEKLNFYKDTVFPKLYDVETIDKSCIVDIHSRIMIDGKRTYQYDYDDLLEHGDGALEYENGSSDEEPAIGYFNAEKYQLMETFPEGRCINMSYGTLGTMVESCSPFVGQDFEEVKSYNCYLDDLSDSYLLMDGEKTVAEAKAEIEAYLDAHFPLVGEDNEIRNEVYKIDVRKIPDTEFHVFNAYRTLTYNGMRVKEEANGWAHLEVGIMGEAILCESDKIDTLRGFVNCFSEGSVLKTYEEFIPFTEAMERLSYYLTGDTIFDIGYMGLEYRMFTEEADDVTYYNWVPYWCFIAKNPNDDKVIRIYMNIETGEMESYEI